MVRGHSDIDVLAISDSELLHIQCQSWWGPFLKDEKLRLQRLKEVFDIAPGQLLKKYQFLASSKIKVRNILVTSGKPLKSKGKAPWDRLQKFCNHNNIELVEINRILDELIAELKQRHPKPQEVGKEKGLARLLIHKIHNRFL